MQGSVATRLHVDSCQSPRARLHAPHEAGQAGRRAGLGSALSPARTGLLPQLLLPLLLLLLLLGHHLLHGIALGGEAPLSRHGSQARASGTTLLVRADSACQVQRCTEVRSPAPRPHLLHSFSGVACCIFCFGPSTALRLCRGGGSIPNLSRRQVRHSFSLHRRRVTSAGGGCTKQEAASPPPSDSAPCAVHAANQLTPLHAAPALQCRRVASQLPHPPTVTGRPVLGAAQAAERVSLQTPSIGTRTCLLPPCPSGSGGCPRCASAETAAAYPPPPAALHHQVLHEQRARPHG